MNEAYDTRGCYASQFLPECQFVYAFSPFVLVMWLDLQQTVDDNDSGQQLRSASMGMTLIEVTQALYPATAAADWCVLYSLLPYFFLLRSSTNMATRPSPQQAPQTYQFKLVLLGKYNRMVASRHLFFSSWQKSLTLGSFYRRICSWQVKVYLLKDMHLFESIDTRLVW